MAWIIIFLTVTDQLNITGLQTIMVHYYPDSTKASYLGTLILLSFNIKTHLLLYVNASSFLVYRAYIISRDV